MNAIVGLFIVVVLELALAALVLVRNPRRPVNRWFAAYATSMATWGALVGLRRIVSPELVLPMVRVLFSVATLIPVTFCQLAMVFPRPTRVRPRVIQAVTAIGLVISGLAFSPWMVKGVEQVDGFSQPLYGPLHKIFALFFLLSFGWGITHLTLKLRQVRGFPRAQLHYVLFGAGLTTAGALATNLIIPLLFGTSRFGVYGPYFTLFWIGFAAHSIVRHRLMDIRVVIRRSAAYATGWALTAGLIIGGGIFVDTLVADVNPTLTPIGAILLGLAGSLMFITVAPRIQRLADRYVYRPAYDSGQLVRAGSHAMGAVADPARVAEVMANLIGGALRLERLTIVSWRRDLQTFQPLFASDIETGFAPPTEALSLSSPMVRELGTSPRALMPDDLASRSSPDILAAVVADFKAWGAEVAVPVRDDQLIALILAGPKLSGDSFFGEDFNLLETLASELAIGLKNAHLYHEVVSIKEYNERVLAHMDSGVIAVREDGVITTFNPAAERITGREVERVLGAPLKSLDAAIQVVLSDSLAGQKDSQTEITVSHGDGRILPLAVHTSALHDHKGRVSGAIAVLNDHSRLKALEEDKRRADRLAAMGALATGIAHEIRNPLVAIKTFAELLPERADDQEFRSTFAKVAVREIHRIEQLLGRLRALAAPTVFPLRPSDIQVPIMETLDLLRGEADRRRVQFLVEIEPELPPILGESDQLKQLFLNLFLNALEVMTAGGTLSVTVRADRERPDRGLVTVRVADTGSGIPREDLARVFEPFFTTKTRGTGLGLAICRSIADAHRAALWAESGPAGVGTAFVAQFPALVGAAVSEVIR